MAIQSVRNGIIGAAKSPVILLIYWLAMLLVALPATFAVREAIGESLQKSLAERTVRDGFDYNWWSEFEQSAQGIAETFSPTLMAGGAFFQNIEDAFSGRLFKIDPALTGFALIFVLIWAFLTAGAIDRFAQTDRKAGRMRFATVGGSYLFRFMRLAVLSGVLYFLIFLLYSWMDERIGKRTIDVTTEGTLLWMTFGILLLIGALMSLVHVIFSYAKIALVFEERKSVLMAALRGITFVLRHPIRTSSVFILFLAVQFVLLLLYHAVSPGIGEDSLGAILLIFLFGQLFLIVRLFLRLSRLSAEVSLYQRLRPRGE